MAILPKVSFPLQGYMPPALDAVSFPVTVHAPTLDGDDFALAVYVPPALGDVDFALTSMGAGEILYGKATVAGAGLAAAIATRLRVLLAVLAGAGLLQVMASRVMSAVVNVVGGGLMDGLATVVRMGQAVIGGVGSLVALGTVVEGEADVGFQGLGMHMQMIL